ncbi:hypothetical protein CERSUDRAFT_95229 [Gelatoporia subvermispora B]|uniref:Ubiquitin 3 binding protein But2 C-terminal domain-containing protein n=1 Tax=Ceriporiopsis subvermispora (strain B) TaxID=914234 RepID=M2RDU0_CERS8|nr:hypothetical protein CERSUDRAFT_95229 [Gelatoporia subvermispora B]
MPDISTLRRPSLYQGLERVPEIKVQLQIEALRMQGHGTTSSMEDTPRPTVRPAGSNGVRASTIARVNSRHPNAHYPEDGWVLLTEEDRALLLFDSHGTGLNSSSCAFAYTFPARADLKDKLLTIENPDTPTVAPLILITSLNIPDQLDLKKITWSSSPVPQSLLGTVPAEFGANGTTEAFECPQNGPMLFELACATPGCRVEYTDDDEEPLLGIRLTTISN